MNTGTETFGLSESHLDAVTSGAAICPMGSCSQCEGHHHFVAHFAPDHSYAVIGCKHCGAFADAEEDEEITELEIDQVEQLRAERDALLSAVKSAHRLLVAGAEGEDKEDHRYMLKRFADAVVPLAKARP